ncbi:MAG: TetR/AcrR family transcriptional regulator [Pelolinea sp.]|jgi:AcrR family transcriptional regulator|nr:TetR/AcrR family transcriptional regulator [Pelolinea sp.]
MQQRSAETKEKILLTAQELFSTAGYDATGVSQICTAAGLSKGAFYHHFPSKHAVFMTLLQNWLDEMDAVFSTASVESNGVLAGISRMANSSDIIFDQVQGHFPLFLEFWSKSIRDERVWEETKQPFLKYYFYFSQMIKDGIAEGSVRPMDAGTASRAILGLAIGIILQGLLYPQEADWKTELQNSMDILLRGLQNE